MLGNFNDGSNFSVKIQRVDPTINHIFFLFSLQISDKLQYPLQSLPSLLWLSQTHFTQNWSAVRLSASANLAMEWKALQTCQGDQANKKGQTVEEDVLKFDRASPLHLPDTTPSLLKQHQILPHALFKQPGCGFLLPWENSQTQAVCIFFLFCRASKKR